MVVVLGRVYVQQNGVIAKCIEQIDAGNDYLEKINKDLKEK